MAITTTCLASCGYVENIYRSHQMSQDLINNRERLYQESFLGVHSEIETKEDEQ